MNKYKKYVGALLILSLLTIGAVAEPNAEHKPKILAGTSYGASTNWAGYALDSPVASVTDVKGSWVVPGVSCVKGKAQYSSFWTGIDGDTSNTVEQIGTDSDCSSNGKTAYYAWYEFYPNPSHIVPIPVSVGDKITAEVSYSVTNGQFTVSITNLRTGQNFQTSSAVSGAQRNSAEWISEAPSSSSGILPLANFNVASYGSDSTGDSNTNFATINGNTGNIGSFYPSSSVTVNEITMVNQFGTAVKAQPSIVLDGTSFSVQWKSKGP